MRLDDIDCVNHLLIEIRASRRTTEVEPWDFMERLAEELVVLRLEGIGLAREANPLSDWAGSA